MNYNELITTNTNANALACARFNTSLFQGFISFLDGSKKTTETYINNLKQFAVWLRYKTINQPAREDVIEYRDWLGTEHRAIEHAESATGWRYREDSNGNPVTLVCKPATVKLYMQSVRQFFKWTATYNLYPNVAEQVKAPKVRNDIHKKDALSASDVLAIEKSIEAKATEKTTLQESQAKDRAGRVQRSTEQGKRLYAMYQLAVNAGLRTVEISRANVKDLEQKGGQAFLYIWGKGHTEADQKKPIALEVYNAVKDYLDSRTDKPTGNSPLFVSTGNRAHGKRIQAKTISTMLKGALVGAGFNSERLTAHSLRHTAGTAVQTLTGDLYATQNYMRHANPATTEIYLHVETEKKDAKIANDLYTFYHGGEVQSSPSKSESEEQNPKNILEGLTPSQLEQLAKYAQALKISSRTNAD